MENLTVPTIQFIVFPSHITKQCDPFPAEKRGRKKKLLFTEVECDLVYT